MKQSKKLSAATESVKEVYRKSSEDGREALETLFGKDTFKERESKSKKKDNRWMDLWKTFCKKNKLKIKLPYAKPKTSLEEWSNAGLMLTNIIRVANKGWVPDFKNSDEYKYYPWFYLDEDSGFAFSDANGACTDTHTHVGSRLCFSSRQTAEETAKAFLPIYEKYHMR